MKNKVQSIIAKIKNRRTLFVEYLIILAVGLISVMWLRGDLIVWKDWMFPMSQSAITRGFERTLFTWDSSMLGLGFQASRFLPFIPYQFFFWFTNHLGVSLIEANVIVFYGLFTLSGLSMHFLINSVLGENKWSVARLSGSLFYMLNFYSLIFIWGGFITGVNFAYSVLPLLIGFTIKAVKGRSHVKYALLISVVWALIGNNTGNPEIALSIFILIFAYVIFNMLFVRNKKRTQQSVRFLLILSIIFFAINAFWIIPTAYSSGEIFNSISREVIGETDQQVFQLSSVPMLGALRLTGSWDLTLGITGVILIMNGLLLFLIRLFSF